MPDLASSIERAYRAAVTGTPYCSISVKSLCESAGVTRKAFYKQFGGKGDVLRGIFERDVVKPQLELIELLSFEKMRLRAAQMEEHMFQAIRDDGEFYRSLVASPQGGREAFLHVVSAVLRDFNDEMLRNFKFRGTERQSDYVSRYFAEAKAHFFLMWIEDGYPMSVADVAKLYSRMALPFWNSLA